VKKLALCAALCGIPAISVNARAQDQSPPPEHKQQEREKNQTVKPEGKQNPPAEKTPGNHATQSRAQEREDHPAEAQPRNGGAQPQNRDARVAQGGHRPAPNAHYRFRQQDVPRLKQHFQSQLAHVDRNNRPHIVAGGSLQGNWQTYIVPVPTEVITYLPPVPEGYQLGFYDGYIIVYDPYSGLVLDVIDLFAY